MNVTFFSSLDTKNSVKNIGIMEEILINNLSKTYIKFENDKERISM